MATVKLGPKFFRKERDTLYSDWPTAFWREMFQNSLDANASVIQIFMADSRDGVRVTFADNGSGMSRETVENVFFSLGETTKGASSTGVGGFGRARILTCFAMDSYSFRTKNLFVKGESAEYEIQEIDGLHRGCEFGIEIGDKGKNELRSALDSVLSMSQLDCEVYIDGERWTNWMHRRRLTRELKCGGVYVNNSKSNSNSNLIIRVNGLYMFNMYAATTSQVIVEIDPKNSRSILTVNRDGMHYSYQNNLTQFLAEIAIDKKSALKSRKRHTVLLEGRGVIVSMAKGEFSTEQPLDRKAASPKFSELQEIDINAPGATDINRTATGTNIIAASSAVDVIEQEIVSGTKYTSDLPSVYINDETDNPKIRKIIPFYDPRAWVHSIKKVRGEEQSYRKGSTYLKVLLCWKVACEEAVHALLRTRQMTSISWMVGWDFSDDTEACHVALPGGHALCLNPVDTSGKIKYSIHDRSDQRAMMALAKHEVAHVMVSWHDENFSTVHTQIDKYYDTSAVLRAMKSAVAAVN